MNLKSLLEHLEHGARRLISRRLLHNGLVQIRIERLALGFDRRDAMAGKNLQPLLLIMFRGFKHH